MKKLIILAVGLLLLSFASIKAEQTSHNLSVFNIDETTESDLYKNFSYTVSSDNIILSFCKDNIDDPDIEFSVQIYSPYGLLVMLNQNCINTTTIDMSGHPSGVYIITVAIKNKPSLTFHIYKP